MEAIDLTDNGLRLLVLVPLRGTSRWRTDFDVVMLDALGLSSRAGDPSLEVGECVRYNPRTRVLAPSRGELSLEDDSGRSLRCLHIPS